MTCPRPLAVALLASGVALASPPPTAFAQGANPAERSASATPPAGPVDPTVSRAGLTSPSRSFPVAGRSSSRAGADAATQDGRGGWWFGPAGVVVVLAAVGGLSWAARRFNLDLGLGAAFGAGGGSGSARLAGRLGVVGSVRLGPKQAVHLVRVGDRVLIVGTGPASAPQTLGEVTDPADLDRLVPHRADLSTTPRRPSGSSPTLASGLVAAGSASRTRLDQRIGDDE